MKSTSYIIFSALIISCFAQRSPYAGRRPIGYPTVISPTTISNDGLGNRFGDTPTTTVRLPIEALGDVDLFNRLSKLPIDQQPFWLINWKALEANRNNPQSYPQRGNSFITTNDVQPTKRS